MTLALDGITHDYGDGPVLHDVSLTVVGGRVHALLGMNGAGKSTLVHVATGQFAPTRGQVVVEGEPVRLDGPGAATRAGIVLLAQEVDRALVPDLTVHENLTVGLLREARTALFHPRRNRALARELLERYDVELDVDRQVADLTLYEKQVLSLVRAVAGRARYVVLDEPTASFDAVETQRFYRIVRAMQADGIGIVFISHRLAEVFELADELTVLRAGRTVLQARAADTDPDAVVEAMTGQRTVAVRRAHRTGSASDEPVVADERPSDERASDERAPVLEVRGLPVGRHRVPVDLRVGRGEVVAVFGLLGAGKSSLAERLLGLHGAYRASVDGHERRIGSPPAAVAAGIALVPEERRRHGLWLDESVATHLSLGLRGLVRPRAEERRAAALVAEYDVQPASTRPVTRRLSGGNQQKVSVAKWAGERRLLVLDEPMKGVDVAAKEAIFQAVERSADAGAGVLYLTAEPDDALRIADRVVVLTRTGVVADLPAADATPLDLMLAVETSE
ncbi:sugar ABC transporter ATP-binding protein [Cellulomonas palmilytica]|uniref:sugar ABC transporter ATP-binding protein n=1 Tax=Cellulomonas palmilytica TaxID=2608402 RepID=UPI001F3DCDD3|nr:sugar ABC transporter ATP-binding protein [Cellulomonas palmilytica]UJP40428.1 sugar ABC transporter ATP-binding protein [Cellulomonas palmilytica]